MKLAMVAEVITHERTTELVTEMQEGKISKGACIRSLFAGGLEVKEISTITGIRYNHVYNVVKNEVLIHGLEVEVSSRNNENSKKNQILVLLSQGKSITEISKEFQCMYNYVWQIAKAGGYTGKKVNNANTEEIVAAESEEKSKKKGKAKIA